DVGLGVLAGARREPAVAQRVPAAGLLVARLDLGDEVLLLQSITERRMAPGRKLERLGETPQDGGEFDGRDAHGVVLWACLSGSRPCFLDRAIVPPSGSGRAPYLSYCAKADDARGMDDGAVETGRNRMECPSKSGHEALLGHWKL